MREEATTLARFFLPQIAFYGITSLGIALLNSRRRFAAAAFAPVLNNVIVIAALSRSPTSSTATSPSTRRSATAGHAAARARDHGRIIAMTWSCGSRMRRAASTSDPGFAVAPSRGARGGPAVGLDRRLRDREPDRAAGRAHPRDRTGGRRSPRTSRVHLLPAPPRAPRGHAHHDVRPRARRASSGETTTPTATGSPSASGSSLW